jgi:hypothetical protein
MRRPDRLSARCDGFGELDSGSSCAATSYGIINQQTESEPDNPLNRAEPLILEAERVDVREPRNELIPSKP